MIAPRARGAALALALTALAAAACYGPRYDECRVFCQLGACPAGQACGDDGYCYPERLDPSAHDCALRPDAALDDGGGETDGGCTHCPFLPSNLSDTSDFAAGTVDLETTDELLVDTDALMVTFSEGEGPPGLFRVQSATPNDLAVLRVRNFLVTPNGKVTVTGARPLVIVAADTIEIEGALTHEGVATACPAASGDGGQTVAGGSGGGGGGFGDAGGRGGDGVATDSNFITGGTGGLPGGDPTLVPLRGGCAGGDGGHAGGVNGGAGGAGGGAIQLVAGGRLAISGLVCISGGGGDAGSFDDVNALSSGGGGGGAGGALLLEAPAVNVAPVATLAAQGGGGGAGAAGGAASDPGTRSCELAGGGTGGASAAICPDQDDNRGGDGGHLDSPEGGAGSGAHEMCQVAGGGGGGGIGRIRINDASGAPFAVPASPAASFGAVVTN